MMSSWVSVIIAEFLSHKQTVFIPKISPKSSQGDLLIGFSETGRFSLTHPAGEVPPSDFPIMSGHNTPEISPQETEAINDDFQDLIFTKRGCCLWIPCFRYDRSHSGGDIWWERIKATEIEEESWWFRKWKKLREWTEIVAGPKWKTFIRRYKRNRTGNGKNGKFNYDPLSYALNFDEGKGENGECDEDCIRRDFSSRFAAIPASMPSSCNSSMDLGKDGICFT